MVLYLFDVLDAFDVFDKLKRSFNMDSKEILWKRSKV